MTFTAYTVVDDPTTPAGTQLTNMVRKTRRKASRLLTAVEDFARDGLSGTLLRRDAAGVREAFLVPPEFVLRHFPDAAVVLRVDHTAKQIEFVEFFDSCDGQVGAQWTAVLAAAQRAAP